MPELVRVLTEDGPDVVRDLENLGVIWDKMDDGSMQVLHGGGTSRKRMVSCRDYIGAIDHAHPDGRGEEPSRT